MWKAQAGMNVAVKQSNDDDDWETDPDFVNDVTEEEQRWGAKTVEGSGRTTAALNMSSLREEVSKNDAEIKKKLYEEAGAKPSYGYGGKFGVQHDRMDKSALGHDHIEKVDKHVSQKDYTSGFGGKFGVEHDKVDRSAVGWDYKHKPEKHESQKDYVTGFGGKFGLQADRQDKSAVGWEYHEKLSQHESQKDYVTGFGGKFGVQTDRQDKSAVGWEYREKLASHESQKDYKEGFGGKFGVQSDRQDKSAVGWEYHQKLSAHESQKDYSRGFGGKYGVQSDRQDKCAKGWDESTAKAPHPSQVDMKIGFGGKFGVQSDRVDRSAHAYKEKDEENNSEITDNKTPTETGKLKTSALRTKFENAALIQDQSSDTIAKRGSPSVKKLISEKAAQEQVAAEHVRENKVVTPVHDEIETGYVDNKSESPVRDEVAEKIPENQEEQTDIAPATEEEIPSEKSGHTAVALYDYEAAAEDELTFDPGEVITNIDMIDEGWWRGECRGKMGLFPANYVELRE